MSKSHLTVTINGTSYQYIAPSKGQTCSRYAQTIGSGKELDQKLPGFGRWPYMPRLYYETLYRALFHTPQYFNLPLIAERNLMPLSLMRFIAIYDFGLSYQLVEEIEDPREIVTIINARKQINLGSEMREGIRELPEQILYQPGSVLARQAESHFYRPTQDISSITPINPDINGQSQREKLYREILRECEEPNSPQHRHRILYYLRMLDLVPMMQQRFKVEYLTQLRTEQLCQSLQRYVKLLLEAGRISYF